MSELLKLLSQPKPDPQQHQPPAKPEPPKTHDSAADTVTTSEEASPSKPLCFVKDLPTEVQAEYTRFMDSARSSNDCYRHIIKPLRALKATTTLLRP